MMSVIEYLSLGIGIAGVAVIAWGALLSIIQFVRLEAAQVMGREICKRRELIRHHFGAYILLGLEFLVAGDVVHTIIKPSLQGMAVLGSIVAIRTVLSYFLNRELATHTCEIPSDK
jgi:uncharacterized membrane protein